MTALALAALSLVTPQTPLWAVVVLALVMGFSAEGWFGLSVIAFAEIGGEEHSGSAREPP